MSSEGRWEGVCRVRSMEFTNGLFGGRQEVGERFPRVVVGGISCPMNLIERLASHHLEVHEIFDLEVFRVIDDFRSGAEGSGLVWSSR